MFGKLLAALVLVAFLFHGTRSVFAETTSTSVETFKRVVEDPEPASSLIDHPLRPVLRTASSSYRACRSGVKDYTCIMVRQERVSGRLGPHEFIYAKVRHRRVDGDRVVVPFSVYLKFLKPTSVKGREVLFVEGENDGEMFARRGGTRFAFVTKRLDPTSRLAMSGNRYPVTEFGVENLLYRLIDTARKDLGSDCKVNYLEGAKVNGRPVSGIVVTHTNPDHTRYQQARIFIDQELDLPIHYEAYGWAPEGRDPPLLEKYTYTDLKLNVGLTDADFSADNPQYRVK